MYMLDVLHEVAAMLMLVCFVGLQRLLWCKPVREFLQGRVRDQQGLA